VKPASVLLLVVGLVVGCGGDDVETRAAAPEATWIAMPDAPLSARYDVTAVAVGAEVLFVGGTSARPCPPNADCTAPTEPPHLDGAAFHVESRSWRSIAPAPQPVQHASTAVLDGAVYVAAEDALLRYEVDDDRWTTYPLPDGYRRLVATDDGVVAFRTTEEHGDAGDDIFDPDTETWTPLPPDPHSQAFDRSMVWTGDRLVLLDVEDVPQPNGVEPSLYRAAALDPSTGRWEELPGADIVAASSSWFVLDDLLVNPTLGELDGGEVNGWGRSIPVGGMFDLERRAWVPLPDHPDGVHWVFGSTVADAQRIVLGDGWVFDGSRWGRLPEPVEDVMGASALAGDTVVVWGGVRWSDDWSESEVLDEGWTIRLS
jgi:hypothetical protein